MKVRIIGAGPSGSVAAISALRAGHEVEVYEEHEKAGYPQHCSGLVSKEGLQSLSDIVDYRPYTINKISRAVFDFAGEEFVIDRKAETACVIDRAAFDHALAQNAEEEGAKIFYGKRFSHCCEASKQKTIIGADGTLSHTAHHFNFPKIKKFAFTLKTKVKISTDEPNTVLMFYDNEKFPGFFGWLIPYNEYEAEIGMGTTEGNAAKMKKGLDFLIEKTGAKESGKPMGRLIPIEPRAKIAESFGSTNVLLVGDAAGQVKSSSGGGVVFGSAGARLAGLYAHSPQEYELKWKMENEKDMLAHTLLRSFFAVQPEFALRFTARFSRYAGLDSMLSLYGNMDRPVRFFSGLSKVFNISSVITMDHGRHGTGKYA